MPLRRRHSRLGLPDDWREILEARSVAWRQLDANERQRLGELADWLLRDRRWEAARGFELTDEVRAVVSAHAVLPILGLDESWYEGVGSDHRARRLDDPAPHRRSCARHVRARPAGRRRRVTSR